MVGPCTPATCCPNSGVVTVEPRHFQSHHEVAAAAAVAKKQAKKISGNSLFVERRQAHVSESMERADAA